MPNMNMVEAVNSAIDTMLSKDEEVIMFGEDVGFSGHGVGFTGTFGSVALGVTVVEKHVTLSRKMSGPDQAASLEFNEVSNLIEESNKIIEAFIHQARGSI